VSVLRNVSTVRKWLIRIAHKECVVLLQLHLLKKNLKLSSSDKSLSASLLGTGLSYAFLSAMVCLLGKPNVTVTLLYICQNSLHDAEFFNV